MLKKRFLFFIVILFVLLIAAAATTLRFQSIASLSGPVMFILFLFSSLLPSAAFAVLYPGSARIRSKRGVLLILLFSLGSFLFGLVPFALLFMKDGPNNYSFFSFYFLQLRIPILYPVFLIFFLVSLWMARVVIPSIPKKNLDT